MATPSCQIKKKPKMVIWPEKDWSYRPKYFGMQAKLNYANNMGWVPSVSPGNIISVSICPNLFLYLKRPKMVLILEKMELLA